MRREYKTNFAGYFTVHRAIQYLLKSKTLSTTEFGAYIYLVAQADYDRTHDTYGVILRSDKEIALELGRNPATVFKQRKTLIKKGLLVERDGFTIVPNFYLFELGWGQKLAKIPPKYLQELFAKPQEGIAGLQDIIAKLQDNQLQKTTQSFNVSSNGNLGSSDVSSQEEINIDEIPEDLGKNEEGDA